jgi:hypothetical protein
MRQSLRKTLLWQAVGLLFYLAGMVLFLVVAVEAFLAPPASSFGNVATGELLVLLVSVVLLVTGRVIGWKLGGDTGVAGTVASVRGRGPEESKLEELGYRMPVEESENSGSGVVYEDGEVYVRCPDCGEPNEREFDYCGNCSSQLPE